MSKRRNGVSQMVVPSFQEDTISSYIKKREKYINPAHQLTNLLSELFAERDYIQKQQQANS